MEFPFVDVELFAEGVGNAPTSACADPVFKTDAASLYLPAFRKVVRVARVALASSSFRTCGRVQTPVYC